MTIKYLTVSWHQNNLKINGTSGVGTEEVFVFYLIIVSWQLNRIQTDVSLIRLRDITSPISYFILSPF